MHLVALLHHPRDTLKDLTLAGHVITITYCILSGGTSHSTDEKHNKLVIAWTV